MIRQLFFFIRSLVVKFVLISLWKHFIKCIRLRSKKARLQLYVCQQLITHMWEKRGIACVCTSYNCRVPYEFGECRLCWWILCKLFYVDYNYICVLLQVGGGLPQLQSHHPRSQGSVFFSRFIINNFIFTLTIFILYFYWRQECGGHSFAKKSGSAIYWILGDVYIRTQIAAMSASRAANNWAAQFQSFGFVNISYGSVILNYRYGSGKPVLITDQDQDRTWTFLWSLKQLCCQTGSKSLKLTKYCTFSIKFVLIFDKIVKIVRIRIFFIDLDPRIRIQNYGSGSWRPIYYGPPDPEHCLFL